MERRSQHQNAIRRYSLFGASAVFIALGSLGAWATLSQISGAVIAPGNVIVEGNSKLVQHREGGIVAELRVEEGDIVEAGQVLVRLDDTEARAELRIIDANRIEFLAKADRLRAARDNLDDINFNELLLLQRTDPEVADVMAGEERLFRARKAAVQSRLDQLEERATQFLQEIQGLESQKDSKQKQSELLDAELADIQPLADKGLVPNARILALTREQAQILGEVGRLTAEIARVRGRISESKLQAIQITDDFRAGAINELRDAEARLNELRERRVAVSARLKRTDIPAPLDGVVHALSIHTVGGVVTPGETLMQIVPQDDELIAEVRVRPQDIDQVYDQQTALLMFPNADARLTPQVNGEVIQISADLKQINPNEPPFYTVRLNLNDDELRKLGDLTLKPGMPVDAFLQTRERTPLAYLLQPLTDQMRQAFREK